MGRAPCCEKVGLKRGPWTPEEDEKLVSYIKEHGHGSWRALPKKAGLLRCGKSCRLRWTNYLRPDIKRGDFSAAEENIIMQMHALLGNRWSAIASYLPKRTDNEIKNYWNTHLRKKLLKMGLDPTTHKPLGDSTVIQSHCSLPKDQGAMQPDVQPNVSNVLTNAINHSCNSIARSDGVLKESTSNLLLQGTKYSEKSPISATLNHLTQWESVRLEAEARLAREAKMRAKGVWRNHSISVQSTVLPMSKNSSQAGGNGLGALSSVRATDLMNSFQNWEKSLQGQAGMLWPESWKQAAACRSHCGGNSESSSSSSSSAAPPACSTSLHSLAAQNKLVMEQIASCSEKASSRPGGRMSWSDALPMSSAQAIVSQTHRTAGGTHPSAERWGIGSFSSLMMDALLGRSHAKYDMDVISLAVAEKDNNVEGLERGSCVVKEQEVASSEHGLDTNDADEAHHAGEETSNASAVTGEMNDEVCIQEDFECPDDDDEDDDDEEDEDDVDEHASGDGTSDLFRDLPKLKKDTPNTRVSYTALLSEEMSDYWSSMVLKEQVSSPTIHINF
ncbi:hypothetical protein KP509_07G029700 [Ceratopteris richardii]|uniref:Uncharacterized protein n=1 Tax=Ceratopteris richardii TaxID=49495 RepID=A0A8T2UJS0_CERRI|nr:hypothetical protein KP509_07G029700 [Ceratopteris richardii]